MKTTHESLHRTCCHGKTVVLSYNGGSVNTNVMKLIIALSTMAFLGTAQSAHSNSGIIVEKGDITYRIPLVAEPVKIDAVLDESVWSKAVKVDANIEVEPGENVPAPVETEAFLSYDEDNIYVAIKAYDPEPDKILARVSDRDRISDDDWVLILFDTFNDNRRFYNFSCNPLGIQADKIESTSGGGESWDAIWKSAGKITDDGYIVEMAIPFNVMSIQDSDGEQTWNFDVVRSYPRNYRHTFGAFPRDRENNCYLCQSVKLVGFEGVKTGKNIEISPTFSTGASQSRDMLGEGRYGPMETANKNSNTGVTAQWGISKNMTLSAAVNPDFSQVEADAAQMDLNTQFPLYYAERRPFFLENSDFYRVGDLVLRFINKMIIFFPKEVFHGKNSHNYRIKQGRRTDIEDVGQRV